MARHWGHHTIAAHNYANWSAVRKTGSDLFAFLRVQPLTKGAKLQSIWSGTELNSDGSYTYYFWVHNLGSKKAEYSFLEADLEVSSAGYYTLLPHGVQDWSLKLPAKRKDIPILAVQPRIPGVRMYVTYSWVEMNKDGSHTYEFSVYNDSPATAAYSLLLGTLKGETWGSHSLGVSSCTTWHADRTGGAGFLPIVSVNPLTPGVRVPLDNSSGDFAPTWVVKLNSDGSRSYFFQMCNWGPTKVKYEFIEADV